MTFPKQNKAESNLKHIEDKKNYTQLRLFIFLFGGSISFNILVSTVLFYLFRLSAGMPGPRGASILRPKMPDIMPVPNLNNIMPFHSGGGGGAA